MVQRRTRTDWGATIKLRSVGVTILITAAFVVGASPAAFAVKDSGVQSKGCSASTFGRLTVSMRGDGNLWAPGDWSARPVWKDSGGSFRTQIAQNAYTRGGYWRAYVNDTYTSATPSCVSAG